jgi:hypothetical protein
VSEENRAKNDKGDVATFLKIESNFKGKFIQLPRGIKIKFIRAAYNRSVVVSGEGEVFSWG